MNPARFRWGILFILAGVMLLLYNLDTFNDYVWWDILSLWPLILIAIGLEKIFTKSRAEFLAYLPILALAGIVLWVALADAGGGRFTSSNDKYRYMVEYEDSVKKIEAEFDLGDIDINLKDTGTRLFRARVGDGQKTPDIDYTDEGGVAKLSVKPGNDRLPDWIHIKKWKRYRDWDLYLYDQVPISLRCIGDQADMDLDCRNLHLQYLHIDSERGHINLQIGNLEDNLKVSLEGKGGDFKVVVPEGSGVSVVGADDDLASVLESKGMEKIDNKFVSAGYDTLTPKIDLDISSDLTRFALSYH